MATAGDDTLIASGERWRGAMAAPQAKGPLAQGPMPTFSVIIAAYQVADVIGDAIRSALAQTLPPHEIVVCDDGSTDDLEEALAPYGDRILLLRKEHAGEASAKNAAARAASGEFVVILDADDVFAPERLEALGALATARPDLDILTSDAYLEANGTVVRRCYTRDWPFEVENQQIEILRRNFILGLAGVRRERLLAHGGFDESILWTTDWDCWIRLILDGSAAGAVMEPLARYRVRETSLSARRLDLTRGKIQTLEKASSRTNLSATQRAALAEALAAYRRELTTAELRLAAVEGDAGARGKAAAVVSDESYAPRARLLAALIATVPALAGAVLRAREKRSWVGAGGTRIARSPDRRSTVARPVRVAIYSPSRTLGGAEVSLRNLVGALDDKLDLAIVGVDRRVVEEIASERLSAPTVIIRPPRGAFDLAALLAHLRALRSLKPDIVHANLGSPWAGNHVLAAAALIRRLRCVVVYQLLVPPTNERQHRITRFLMRTADAHVGVGTRTSRQAERLLGLPAESVRTIFNGVPDLPAREPRGGDNGEVVGSIGRLEMQKGYDVLLRALALLPHTTRAVVVGEGTERRKLESLAADLGVASRIRWAGWSDKPREVLASLDVFVLPSRFEGLPLAILEALLAELPVVATDVGSVDDAVRPGETGILVSPDDPEALAHALRDLLRDPALRRKLGHRGRERVLACFTSDVMARRFHALYREILG